MKKTPVLPKIHPPTTKRAVTLPTTTMMTTKTKTIKRRKTRRRKTRNTLLALRHLRPTKEEKEDVAHVKHVWLKNATRANTAKIKNQTVVQAH